MREGGLEKEWWCGVVGGLRTYVSAFAIKKIFLLIVNYYTFKNNKFTTFFCDFMFNSNYN